MNRVVKGTVKSQGEKEPNKPITSMLIILNGGNDKKVTNSFGHGIENVVCNDENICTKPVQKSKKKIS